MEGDLRAIVGFADALALVSETIDESPHGSTTTASLGRIRSGRIAQYF
jgi:hypothetical protein